MELLTAASQEYEVPLRHIGHVSMMSDQTMLWLADSDEQNPRALLALHREAEL
jgi:hypothetical protein